MLSISLFIFILLLIATLIIEYKLASNNTMENKNNRQRIYTWWVITLICIPVLYIGGWAITLLVYVLIYWAMYELSKLLDFNFNSLTIALFTTAMISYHFIALSFNNEYGLFFIIPFIIYLILFYMSKAMSNITDLHRSLMLVLCVTSLFTIELISVLCNSLPYDAGLVILFLFFLTASNDIFQYICGKLFGHKQLAPVVSKNKTYEGALGGVVLTTILSMMITPYVFSVNILIAAGTGFLIAILGIVGDLNISYLKRRVNVKDAGNSLPGHGGLLDRIDSLILTAPGFGLFLSLIST